ncbi:hypothetical protein IMZ08_17255 [Bacillus luteolus]|uniref:Uncharacterized protein n=1 Tax=Litchfieldia luteola TaxID=682179 RepID=A0ABR9QMR0_9BACI|nr:hypothetical protein [Cytobacillus luteolus]MBE4909784.1 hypothetical protein [Cytobacillus luteolus]MBP1942673.1 hypothetical protein [Cytobacillus luteolus]
MKKITKLEYRLNDPHSNYPAIYHYNHLEQTEIFSRRLCDYFIKDRKVYSKTSTALERDMYVIYVEEDKEETPFQTGTTYSHVTLELRLFKENAESNLLFKYDLHSHEDALTFIGNDYLLLGEIEYEKVSSEIDEDRSTYVVYLTIV